MFVHPGEAEGIRDVRLARHYPQIHEVKVKAKEEYNPMKDLINFFEKLFAKKAE